MGFSRNDDKIAIEDADTGDTVSVIDDTDSGSKRLAIDTVLRGRDGVHTADVVLEDGVRRLQTTAQATITGGLFGRTVYPSTILTIDTAPTSGDTHRLQIPDDSVDVTTNFATESLIEAAKRIRNDLNADSNFDALYTASVPTDSNQVYIEANEIYTLRTDASDVLSSVTGSTVAVTLLYDTIDERNIDLAIFPSRSDARKGTINVQGEVGSLITGRPPKRLEIETSGNSPEMNVNGSSVNVTFALTNNSEWDATRDFICTELRIEATDGSLSNSSNKFMGISSLTNGIQVQIRSEGSIEYDENLKATPDIMHFFAFGNDSKFQLEAGPSDDQLVAVFAVPFFIRRAGTFSTDDEVTVTVKDDLTSVARLRMSAVGFFED